jgi:hypothetical protein
VPKVEWHPGELYPRVGVLVTNLCRRAERVVAFYNGRGTAEQWVKEGKIALKWTRLSCRSMKANAVRLQLHSSAPWFYQMRLSVVSDHPAREGVQDHVWLNASAPVDQYVVPIEFFPAYAS